MSSVNIGGNEVKCVGHVRDLCVFMENNLSFDRYIRKKCKIANVQLCNISEASLNTAHKTTDTGSLSQPF